MIAVVNHFTSVWKTVLIWFRDGGEEWGGGDKRRIIVHAGEGVRVWPILLQDISFINETLCGAHKL